MSPGDVTYHIIGLNCPDLPRDLMGTKHGVTQFPASANCGKCRVEWSRLLDAGEPIPEMNTDDPSIKLPTMYLSRHGELKLRKKTA